MTTPKRPEGYREPTGEDMKCLPEGALVYYNQEWVHSAKIGAIANVALSYAVPITKPSKMPTLDPKGEAGATKYPLSEQIGGGHYKSFKIQPAEFITANGLGFLEGCVIKRMCRHGSKNKAEDIRKAIHELQLILKLQYNENE